MADPAFPLPPFSLAVRWHDGEEFHRDAVPVYDLNDATRRLYKRADHMAHVRYRPAHPHPCYADSRAGEGTAHCVWIASEQGAQAEGISRGGLDAILDTWLEPTASIGWHRHDTTEEVYYLLAGSLDVWTEDDHGAQHRWTLQRGDSARVGPGMSHSAQAGDEGARFVVVILKVDPAT